MAARRSRKPQQAKKTWPSIKKRSIAVGGHRTSVSLEEPFWQALKEMAGRRGVAVSELIAEVDADRAAANLSSALRVYVLENFRAEPRPGGEGQQYPRTE